MDSKKIGLFIKKLREEKGWTQEVLAKKLYISREAVSKWEREKNLPDISSLINLSKLLK